MTPAEILLWFQTRSLTAGTSDIYGCSPARYYIRHLFFFLHVHANMQEEAPFVQNEILHIYFFFSAPKARPFTCTYIVHAVLYIRGSLWAGICRYLEVTYKVALKYMYVT